MFRRTKWHCPLCKWFRATTNSTAKYGPIFLYWAAREDLPLLRSLTCSVCPLHTRAVNTGSVWHYLKEISAPNMTKTSSALFPWELSWLYYPKINKGNLSFMQIQPEMPWTLSVFGFQWPHSTTDHLTKYNKYSLFGCSWIMGVKW